MHCGVSAANAESKRANAKKLQMQMCMDFVSSGSFAHVQAPDPSLESAI